MSTEAWIFMVGLRVFDVGALIVWLVWFFKLREEDDADDDAPRDDFGGGTQEPVEPRPPAPVCEDRPRVRRPWRHRRRDRRPVAEPGRGRALR